MNTTRFPSRVALLLVLSSTIACGSSSEYVPIPVEDARALNSQVTAFYGGTQELLDEAAADVPAVAELPHNVRADEFEIQLVKNALMSCFNETITVTSVSVEAPRAVRASAGDTPGLPLSNRDDLGAVPHCSPSDLISLESYLEYAPPAVSEFIVERMLIVDSLRVNLKHVLQERLNILEETALEARSEVVRLRETSSDRYETVTSGDGGYTQEQILQTEADFEVIQGELDDVEELVETITDRLPGMRNLRRQLVEDISVGLAGLGGGDS